MRSSRRRPSTAISPVLRPACTQSTSESGGDRDPTSAARHPQDNLIHQVSEWIERERTKKKARRKTPKHAEQKGVVGGDDDGGLHPMSAAARRDSDSSQSSLNLDQLDEIVKRSATHDKAPVRRSLHHKASALKMRLRRASSADVDAAAAGDGDAHVPWTDAALDNSCTIAYAGGASEESDLSDDDGTVAAHPDRDAWSQFKFQIVRLTHTLKIRGWNKLVPMEWSGKIKVERLSGALTNAVYVVSPPEDLPVPPPNTPSTTPTKKGDKKGTPLGPPPKLLLRIYGPQVGHLIDRESELAILRRLARQRIGPRMFGTFRNGRFEEYLNAKPLSPDELRDPKVSAQIAKRMRELHDGIELLDSERTAGPFVWQNWDKWVARVERVVMWLDEQVEKVEPGDKPSGDDAWKRRGYICGAPWKEFRAMVDKYRAWLQSQYTDDAHLRAKLVFAHNDTQHGNILRYLPTGDSPLLLPVNSHKQLVVIDFEYANANVPGLEFANHFSEWCYNYRDPKKPHAFLPNYYPTPPEQESFLRAYMRHRPDPPAPSPRVDPQTPTPDDAPSPSSHCPRPRPTSTISDFMLDARTPAPAPQQQQQQQQPRSDTPADAPADDPDEAGAMERLLHETRIWRMANTAQWVAWGIVQAKVPGMPHFPDDDDDDDDCVVPGDPSDPDRDPATPSSSDSDTDLAAKQQAAAAAHIAHDGEASSAAAAAFDYLGYAQHRALFFWGDAMQWRLCAPDALAPELRDRIKTVPY